VGKYVFKAFSYKESLHSVLIKILRAPLSF
jgi:hypothetical protein